MSAMQTSAAEAGPVRPAPQYPIESVDRALRLLRMFSATRELRLSDARDALGVGQSTAHRLMAMLVHHGFVDQDPASRVYRAGPALVEIGLSVVNQMDLRAVARPVLQWLAENTGETVHLGSLEGSQVRFLDVIESDRALRVSGRVGRTLPAHATSLGKAMLAQLPDDQIAQRYPDEVLGQVTTKTMTSRSTLLAEIERIRRRGYALNAGESEDGVSSIGCAVARPDGPLLGGLSVAAPTGRMTKAQRDEHAVALVEACRRLAEKLG